MLFYQILIFLSYFLPFVTLILLWPSKRNVLFFQHLPMFFIAYFGYVFFFFDEAYYAHSMKFENLESLTYILFIGGLIATFATYVGYSVHLKLKDRLLKITEYKQFIVIKHNEKFKNTIFLFSFLGILFMSFAYIKMGFIPILAENPFAAKYFSGEYQEAYRPVAPFFRIGLNILVLFFPFLILYSFTNINKNRIFSVILFLISFLFLFSTLRRGPIAAGFVYFFMLFSIYYKNGKYLVPFFIIYFVIWCIGSSFNDLFLYIIGLKNSFSILAIFHGLPDIKDLFWFWNSFQENHKELAYGRLIYGGLIPYHYEWNPGNYTKLVIGGTGYEASGGFRLPPAVWGYVNFGWLGVLIWSTWNGLITGIGLKLYKTLILKYKNNLLYLYISFFIFSLYYNFLNGILMLHLDSVFSFIVGLYSITFFKFKNTVLKTIY